MPGNLTFLFTDLEGSTRLWEQHPEQMSRALAGHDTLAREIVTEHGGQIVKARGEGDSLFCVFDHAASAIRAATALQRRLLSEHWPAPVTLHARNKREGRRIIRLTLGHGSAIALFAFSIADIMLLQVPGYGG